MLFCPTRKWSRAPVILCLRLARLIGAELVITWTECNRVVHKDCVPMVVHDHDCPGNVVEIEKCTFVG